MKQQTRNPKLAGVWTALLTLLLLAAPFSVVAAQIEGPPSFKLEPGTISSLELETTPSNVINDLDASLGYLWVATSKGLGRFQSSGLASDPTAGSWVKFTREDGFLGRGGVSATTGASVALGDYILAACSIDSVIDGEEYHVGAGIGYSSDDGVSWTWFPQPVDDKNETAYEPTTTDVLNVAYDLAMQGSKIWAANFGGGLRYYDLANPDAGWVVRPPDSNPFDAARYRNHLAVSVTANDSLLLVGTSSGLNISRDSGDTWTNVDFSATDTTTLTGNWVTAVTIQPRENGEVSLWAVSRSTDVAGEFSGVCVSDDLGNHWRRVLGTSDDPIVAHNIVVDDSTVYVASEDGLYKSIDQGETWGLYGPVYDDETEERTWYPDVFAAAVYAGFLWRAGPEGLAVTSDGGLNWSLMRTHAPVGVTGAPDAYAYPNPFSPSRHEVVRIRYTMPKTGEVTVEVYDFAMELLVRPVKDRPRPAGDHNEVWDGLGPDGREVANGVYFVHVVGGGNDAWTKILLMD